MKVRNGQEAQGTSLLLEVGWGHWNCLKKWRKVRKIRFLFKPCVSVPRLFTCLYLVLCYEFHQEHLGGLGVEVKVET